MDMHQGHHHSSYAVMPAMEHSYTHMTFFWGAHAEVLFKGWPGTRPGMYPLALALVFALSAALEWLDHRFLACTNVKGARDITAGLGRTAVPAVRVAISYVVMLAVMSFNVEILMAAVVGRAAGFLVFRSSLFRGSTSEPGDDGACHPPTMSC